MKTFTTPCATGNDDDPNRIVTVQMYLIDLVNLENFASYFCRHAKQGYDCPPNSFEHRHLMTFMRNTIQAVDPEYAQQMYDQLAQLKIPANHQTSCPARIKEIHHHHYHEPKIMPRG